MRATWKFLTLAALVIGSVFAVTGAVAATPVSGATFTTDSTCTGTNVNIFGSKDAVYVDGGPAHPNAAGLPDGNYYVQVTAPDGTVLGQSVTASVSVSGGEFAQCYQLSAILFTASSGYITAGYDTTTNPGGEYKVWISTVSTFDNDVTKTDNFKVHEVAGCPPDCPDLPTATLHVTKFYDANANGVKDGSEGFITGWKVNIHDGINFDRFTPVSMIVDPDDYVVTEYQPIETNWYSTTTNPVNITLADGDDTTVTFGNVCTVAGSGGLTLGFWSNRNGQALITANDLQALRDLHLAAANGLPFDPTTNAQVKSFLLSANATNMANMLSAQLIATTLDVRHGFLSSSQVILVGGSFTTIGAVLTAAEAALANDSITLSGDPNRAGQEALKNALDGLNNNTVPFASSTPCPFSFAS
jgi:hypothetical protein